MRLTLIRPAIGRLAQNAPGLDGGNMQPLGLAVLAGLTSPDVEVAFVDDRLTDIDFDAATDLVAITVETFTAARAYQIADVFRQRQVPVVLGGLHVKLLPDEAAQHADSVVTGDAEAVWNTLLDDARRGRLRPRYDGGATLPAPGVQPRRSIFDGLRYLPLQLAQFSRGCRNGCRYCAVSVAAQRQHRCRPVAEVVAEIEQQRLDRIFFIDDNIVADPAAAKQLFAALRPLKIRWISQASLELVEDRELLRLMAASGCVGNVIGFESIEPRNLEWMDKRHNARGFDRYRGAIAALRDHGLQTWAAFTVGHEHDSVDLIKRTVEFAIDARFALAAFNLLMPYPGTALYRELAEQGRLLFDGRWWLHPDYRYDEAAFVPRKMTADELTTTCAWATRQFYSTGSIVRRALDLKTTLSDPFRLAMYVLYNIVCRRAAR